MDQLARVKDLPAPEFGSLQAWEVRANAVARGANGDNANDSKSGQGLGFGGTPMPFVGETKVLLPNWKRKKEILLLQFLTLKLIIMRF